MLIGRINDSKYQKVLVTLRNIKGSTMIDFRVHHLGTDGELVATPAGISLTVEQTERAIELLSKAKQVVMEQS